MKKIFVRLFLFLLIVAGFNMKFHESTYCENYNNIVIVQQPMDLKLNVGDRVVTSIEASGNGITYEWQYQLKDQTEWYNWGTGNPFVSPYTATEGWDGLKFRCIVKDESGNYVISEEKSVAIKKGPVITKQPADLTLSIGEQAVTSIEASGNGITYEWQYKLKDQTEWYSWGTGNPFASPYTATEGWDGLKFRCIVKDESGNYVISEEKSVAIKKGPVITKQPADLTLSIGDQAVTSIEASGNGITYEWQYKLKDQTEWYSWGTGNPFVSPYTATEGWSGLKFRCIVKDESGNYVISEVKTILLIKKDDWETPIL